MRRVFAFAGIVCALAGLLFLGQGSGYFPYPRTSFMVSDPTWAYRGVAMITLGVAALVVSRAIRRP